MASSASCGTTNALPRKALLHAVSLVCKEEGYHGASKLALETLTEMLQSYITEVATCSREYCELCHRTYPDVTDVKMALVDVGSNIDSLDTYTKRKGKEAVKIPGKAKPPSSPKQLQSTLSKQSRPSYVPMHLPPFPDVHAYIKTPTLRKPVTEYRIIREKFAAQKKNVEESLTGFMARTRPAETKIFSGIDLVKYPLVGHEPVHVPYLTALIPSEEDRNSAELTQETKKFYDDSEEEYRETQENLKEIADNPYMKVPRKSKAR